MEYIYCDICYLVELWKNVDGCNCKINICLECLINICRSNKTDVLFIFYDLCYKCPLCRKYIYKPRFFEFLIKYEKEKIEWEIYYYIINFMLNL